jgi:hypothetical protein
VLSKARMYEIARSCLTCHLRTSSVQLPESSTHGACIKGDFSHLEGAGPSARFMRFAEVDAHADELAAVAKAWCRLVEGKPG